MLVNGEIDAVISARPPNVFLDGKHGIKRLIPDYRAQEQEYFRKTGIFPIMHLVVLRRDAYEANRWIARNLMEAFEKAKRACLPAHQGQTSFLPTAWGYDHAEQTNRMMFPADDPWPYGIENNRKTLEPFLAFCHEQGVTKRKLAVEELFPKEVSVELKIDPTIHVMPGLVPSIYTFLLFAKQDMDGGDIGEQATPSAFGRLRPAMTDLSSQSRLMPEPLMILIHLS